MRKINKIILHCSATKEGRHFTAGDIDRWHREQGYTMIGYHYVVLLDGTVETGRQIEEPGAHCKGHNAHSIGICYIGGLDHYGKPKDTRTKQQRETLRALITKWKYQYKVNEVVGHSQLPGVKKSCPCFDARKEYENV